ncbi:MAG: hypothetical protein IJ799_02795 [Bacteroidales bacterium]|nr:hypothetical protein [Bacteroidales bacterium]
MRTDTLILALTALLSACTPGGGISGGGSSGDGAKEPWTVRARETPSAEWREYKAWTVDRLPGFEAGEEPKTDRYGGWMTGNKYDATGFFRVQKEGSRWYIVSPEGNPMVSALVGAFVVGGSARQQQALAATFGTTQRWAASEMYWLRSKGFTGVAGSTSVVRGVAERMAYNVFLNPMTAYVRELRKTMKVPDKMPVVFDEGYSQELLTQMTWLEKYSGDPFCFGVTTDDELYWTDDMLKIYLTVFPEGNPNRTAAQEWLDARKGCSGCTLQDADAADIQCFKAFCLEEYLKKTASAVRQAAPGTMYLGPRFYKWAWELSSREMMEVAGRYVDIVCINHFTKWEPSQEDLADWSEWSGRPVMITSFDVKGEDSGLPNTGGLGWIVPTQEDRGRFYENFVISLVKSGCCVGWQWYTYMDNDPEDTTADASNKDSNKGIVAWDFSRHEPLVSHMEAVNKQLYNLTLYFKK